MADNNYLLTQVIQRYDTKLHGTVDYFYTDLHLKGFDKEFIFAILNAFEENVFNAKEFEPFSIEMIVDYIQRTHTFYLQKKLPELEQSILLLSDQYKPNHPLLKSLHSFFHHYCKELTTHFNDEESMLLPYVVMLRKAENSQKHLSQLILLNQKYSIAQFLSEHDDTEVELTEIRNTISMYNPPSTNLSLYRILLTQLQIFEQDLHVHALMEEEVLIPKALKIENTLTAKLKQSMSLN